MAVGYGRASAGATEFGPASGYSSSSPRGHAHQDDLETFVERFHGGPPIDTTVRGGLTHSPTALHCQIAGATGPQVGYIAAGWPHPGTARSALPCGDTQGACPPICLLPTALGHFSTVTSGRQMRHGWHCQPSGTGAACRPATKGDGRMDPVPLPGIAGGGDPIGNIS